MRQNVIALAVLIAGFAIAWLASGDERTQPLAIATPQQRPLNQADLAAGFTFGPGIDSTNRPAIEQAIATARPEAQALIARVDGLTTLAAGVPSRSGAAGTTRPLLDGRYEVVLDTGGVYRRLGQRGINRLVLHELAHVVDLALLAPEMRARLDATIPPGLPCTSSTPTGSCAPRPERFAETFAKWAMSDVGYDLWIGYAVPAPSDLAAWAAPLAELGA